MEDGLKSFPWDQLLQGQAIELVETFFRQPNLLS